MNIGNDEIIADGLKPDDEGIVELDKEEKDKEWINSNVSSNKKDFRI